MHWFTADPHYAHDRVIGFLASIDMIDAAQACALLRIETDDPESAMRAMARDDAIVTLVQNGEIRLPLFQFDLMKGLVFGVVRDLLKLRPARISNLRLCYWLTRTHLDFGGPPANRFGKDDGAILAAFRRYIEPERHGYLPRKLTEAGSTRFGDEAPGDLCYYAPWGNLALFHAAYRWSRGLIRLGRLDGGPAPLLVRGEYPLRVEPLA